MKKLYLLFTFFLISSLSFGQVLVAEDFDYPDGSLVPNGGWVNTSGTAGDFLVSGGQAVVEHGTPSEDVQIGFTSVSGDIFYAFDFSVDDLGTPWSGTDSEYFAHLDFKARMDIVPPSAAGDYSVGISSGTSTAEATWASDLTFGTTYRVVVKFDQVGGIAQLWLDPALETDTSIAGTASAGTVAGFDLRQSDSSVNETIRVDNLMVGQTFNDVLVFAAPTDPSIVINTPADGEIFAPGTTSINVTFTTENITTETVDITVNGTVTSDVSSPFSVATADGQTYSVTVDLMDGANVVDSSSIVFSVASYTTVTDIAELRASPTGGYYELTGEAIISYIVNDPDPKGQKYVQDATGGLLIYDENGVLTTTFSIGDGLTSLKGQLSQYAYVLQLIPTENISTPSSSGNTITPQVITISEFLTNGEDYESELIQIDDITFAVTGNFADDSNYDITDGTDTTVCRVQFGSEDLIGAVIPEATSCVVGLGGQYYNTRQIYPRYISDICGATASADYIQIDGFSVYPNPVENTLYIKTKANASKQVQIFDLLGKKVVDQTVEGQSMNLNLNTGVYVIMVEENGKTASQKLMVK